MYKRIPFEQRSPEWLEYRKTKIGASDAATIMNMNPWQTPRELFRQKMGITEANFDNAKMQAGREMESVAIEAFKNQFHHNFVLEQPTIESIEFPWMFASLDGFYEPKSFVIESKSGKSAHKIALTGQVPEYYFPQCQQILCVTGFERMFFWSYYPCYKGLDRIMIEVERDEPFICELIKETRKFWDCMLNLEEPTNEGVEFQ